MDLITIIETLGDGPVLALGGVAVGAAFGFAAQRSRFCLRAASIEFFHGHVGQKVAIWLMAFATAVVWTQAFILLGRPDVSEARQLAQRGSLSGAVIGGLIFSAGMIMTRGCASRLLGCRRAWPSLSPRPCCHACDWLGAGRPRRRKSDSQTCAWCQHQGRSDRSPAGRHRRHEQRQILGVLERRPAFSQEA
ncbi:YeeE/YedE thiosulfate transporter family protein [Rhodoplanes sp.]|uniref:YeeE/YedE thiosulfate transporter family protein n=1 Tax=Rhodoplanes sp. TaxID=1968906 RepID=UPI00345BA58A